MTQHEVATLLGVHDKTVQRNVRPSLMVGSMARFLWPDVEEQLRWRSPPPPVAKPKRRPAQTTPRPEGTAGGDAGIRSLEYWEQALEADS